MMEQEQIVEIQENGKLQLASSEENDRVVTGYMCKVAWDYELGNALGGERIYPSQADLISNHNCTDQCGMVEVEVRLKRIVKESDFSIKPNKTYMVSQLGANGKREVVKKTGKELLERK